MTHGPQEDLIIRVNELDQALKRLQESKRATTVATEKSAALLAEFTDRMLSLGVAPIPVGYYEDLGVTGWFGHRRAASFKQKETGWVLTCRNERMLGRNEGMFVSKDGRLFKGPHLQVMRRNQKKTNEIPHLNFYFPPKDGFAFCFNNANWSVWLAKNSWTFREVHDASPYVDDLAASVATVFATEPNS